MWLCFFKLDFFSFWAQLATVVRNSEWLWCSGCTYFGNPGCCCQRWPCKGQLFVSHFKELVSWKARTFHGNAWSWEDFKIHTCYAALQFVDDIFRLVSVAVDDIWLPTLQRYNHKHIPFCLFCFNTNDCQLGFLWHWDSMRACTEFSERHIWFMRQNGLNEHNSLCSVVLELHNPHDFNSNTNHLPTLKWIDICIFIQKNYIAIYDSF